MNNVDSYVITVPMIQRLKCMFSSDAYLEACCDKVNHILQCMAVSILNTYFTLSVAYRVIVA